MRLLSLNVSQIQTVMIGGKHVDTGIYKTPVETPVMLRTLNFDGDAQADFINHGGADKAVYAYPTEHYPYWGTTLGRDDLANGQFGENLTTEGLLEDEVYLGDIFRIGQATLQVSQARIPCYKLEHKMGVHGFVKQFAQSGKPGIYFRVLEEGLVTAGDSITRLERGAGEVTVEMMARAINRWKESADLLCHILAAPVLSDGIRAMLERVLVKAESL